MTGKDSSLDNTGRFSETRRQFMGRAGRVGALALGAPVFAGSWVTEAQGGEARRYAAGSYGLELDGQFSGMLAGFSGGSVTADVIKEQVGPDLIQRKRLGVLRVEPITIETGISMSRPFFDWIRFVNPTQRRNGAIVEYDPNYKEMGSRRFTNALITEVEFPGCDAASKEPAKLTVSFIPERVDLVGGTGRTAQGLKSPAHSQFLRSNFRLRILGLEKTTERALTIEPISIKGTLAQGPGPDARTASVRATALDVSNLVVTIPDSFIGPMYKWHEDFVVKGGSNDPRKELQGTLEYLGSDSRPMLTLGLMNLGIIKLAPDAQTQQTGVRRSKVEMYCESMRVDVRSQ
jgi:hypothetical protein